MHACYHQPNLVPIFTPKLCRYENSDPLGTKPRYVDCQTAAQESVMMISKCMRL